MERSVRERLAGILRREIDAPGSAGAPLEELRRASLAEEPLLKLLAAAEERSRHVLAAKTGHVWARRFGWRIMRPLFLLALAAAVGFCLQRAVDPALGITLFLGGAAALYVLIQLFAHLWAERESRKLEGIETRYRDRLRALLEELERPPERGKDGP